jgi:guanylate kinase
MGNPQHREGKQQGGSKGMKARTHWLEQAEWVSVSAAVVGSVATGVSQQAILATAPLSVSLMLNLVNRRRAQQVMREQSERRIEHLHQDFIALNQLLSQGVESIRQQLLALPTAPEQIDFTPVEEVIAAVKSELESRLMEVELADLSSVRQGVEQLQSELAQMREQIQALFEEEDSRPAFDPAPLFELQHGSVTQLQANTAVQADASFTLSDAEIGNLQQWQNEIEETTEVRTGMQGYSTMSALDASAIQERLLQLQGAIAQLQLQGQRPAVVDLSALQGQLAQLNQRLEQQASATPIAVEQRLEQLQSAITQLAEEVRNPPTSDDTALIFSAMRSLYERQNTMEQDFITTVKSEIQTALAGVALPGDASSSPAIVQEMHELRDALTQVQPALSHLQAQAGGADWTPLAEQIEQGIAQVRLEVAQVEGKVRDVSVQLADLNALQQQISVMQQQLKEGFAQVQALFAQLPQGEATATVELTPLTQQLKQLEQRLAQMSETLDVSALEQRIEGLSNTMQQWRSEGKATPNEDSDFIFSAMRSLYERQNAMEQEIINGVKTEVQKQLAPLIAIDSDAIQEGMSQLQVEVARLQGQLQVPVAAPKVDLSGVERQIAQLKQRLEQQPAPFDPAPLERRIEQLQATFASWQDEVENSALREDLKLFFAAMRGFSDRRNS